MKKIYSTIFAITVMLFSFAQKSYAQQNLWNEVNPTSIDLKGERQLIPDEYITLKAEITTLEQILDDAPLQNSTTAEDVILFLPMPDGSYERFRIVESPIMASELSAKFPEIKTYKAYGVDSPTATGRLDFTPKGFHALIMSPQGTVYIDPYSTRDIDNYVVYYKRNYKKNDVKSFIEFDLIDERSAEDIRLINEGRKRKGGTQLRSGGDFRIYRIAVSCTNEYGDFHGGTVPLALAAITTSMNRVNEVYERDLGVTMQLVANNDLIVYTSTVPDPGYNNSSAGTLIGQSQTNIDLVINDANYDIGHTFSTGAGGLAGLGVVCLTGQKARGVTGTSNPIGDPFDIDYVSHEIGHQFAGNHTFNGAAGSCSGGNRNGSTAYEPGSGTTIQAYAGICGSNNIQSNSDDYFHGVSLDEMITYSTVASGNTCPVTMPIGNNAPVVTVDPPNTYTIPISTPFTLTGSATDADSDPLTFCWEQFDLGPQESPTNSASLGPLFRTFSPVLNPSRTFPQISDIVNNTQTIGELLPSVSRTLTFRLTARDNGVTGLGGCIGDATTSVEVDNIAGPFLVISPNTSITWTAGAMETVTWDVANTTAAPVSCANVDILLSTDGGFTFPISLASNVTNDGSQDIVVPSNEGSNVRVQVVCSDNIFFDISNTNFSIVLPSCPVATAVADGSTSICSGDLGTEVTDWQALVAAANPMGLEYSSVTPVAGTTLPDGMLPSGLNSTGNPPVDQVVMAYVYCDVDESGTVNTGDTYDLVSTYTLTVQAATGAPTLEDINVCDGASTLIDLSSGNTGTSELIAFEDFDGGGIGYTPSIDFNNGGSDHFSITDGSDIANTSGDYSFEGGGNMFWAAEDTDDENGNAEQNIVTNSVSIAGYTNIIVCIDAAAGNENGIGNSAYDASDYFQFQYNTDVQPLFVDAINFAYFDNGDAFNEPLHHDINRDGDGSDGPQIVNAAQTFCFEIPSANTTDVGAVMMSLRVIVRMDAGNEEIAFDNLTLSGIPSATQYKFYDANPAAGGTLLAGPTDMYDPMTTAATSPQSVWVVECSVPCDSEAEEVVITVNDGPTVEFTAPADLCLNDGVQTGLSGGIPQGTAMTTWTLNDVTFEDGATATGFFEYAPGDVDPTNWSIEVMGGNIATFSPVTYTPANSNSTVSTDDRVSFSFNDLSGGPFPSPRLIRMSMGSSFLTSGGDIPLDLSIANTNNECFTCSPFRLINGGSVSGGNLPNGVYSGTGVTDDGNGMTYSFDPMTAGVGSHTITYAYTDLNGCTNSASDDIQVFNVPTAVFTAPADLCINSGVQNGLSGGTPTGGVYSGAGVTDDGNGMTYSFDPAIAGLGTHTITYDLGVSGCSDSASDDIEVFDLPIVSMTSALSYCLDAEIQNIAITGGSPSGGVYSGVGVTDLGDGIGYNFDPTVNGVGTVTVTYTLTDANGCSNSASSDIDIYDCDFEIVDPCACLDNSTPFDCNNNTGGDDGQFSEVVSITDATGAQLPNGQTWTIVGATGAFDANNIPAVGVQSAGLPVPADGSETLTYNSGVYEIPFVHVDDIGYTLMIEGPFPVGSAANVTLTVSNKCQYPDPIFDPEVPLTIKQTDTAITLGAMDTNGGSSDLLTFTVDGAPAAEIDPASLALGLHTVVMTYDGAADGNGGVSPDGGTTAASPGCIQIVEKEFEVRDCELIVDCSNITDETLACRADLPPVDFTLPMVTDSCGDLTFSALTIIPGNLGCPNDTLTITRTYFIQDVTGNMEQCMQTFTVISTMDPAFTNFPSDTVVLCGASVDPADLGMPGGTQECDFSAGDAVITFADAITPGGCPQEETITRTWTVTDACGRAVDMDQVIMVVDTVAPTMVCQAATLELDDNGMISLTTADLDDGSSDNCGGTVSLSLSMSSFTCDNLGTNDVWLIGEDECGNVDSCMAVVTVEDNVAPIAMCQDVTISLDANGNGSIAASSGATVTTYSLGAATQLESDVIATACGPSSSASTICDCPTGFVATGIEGLESTDFGGLVGEFNLICRELMSNGSLGATTEVTCSSGTANTALALGPVETTGNDVLVGAQSRIGCAFDRVTVFSRSMTEVIGGSDNASAPEEGAIFGSNGGTGGGVRPLRSAPDGSVIVGMQTFTSSSTTGYSGGVAWRVAPIQENIVQLGSGFTINNGSNDNCTPDDELIFGVTRSEFNCSDIPAGQASVVIEVTMTVTDAENNTSMCTANVTIMDDMPPVVECPGDIGVQLEAGECEELVFFDIPFSDNCGAIDAEASQAINEALINDALDCANNTSNHLRYFENSLPVPVEITQVSFGVFNTGAAETVTVNVYSIDPGALFEYGNMTLEGTVDYSVPSGMNNMVMTAMVEATIPVGMNYVLELKANNTTNFVIGYNDLGETASSYLAGNDPVPCVSLEPTDIDDIGFPTLAVVLFSNAEGGTTIEQIAGLPSGVYYPQGVTTNTFIVTDVNGNSTECTFDVTLFEFENGVTGVMACNDNINVSLDINCEVILGADMLLEGGAYGCYDDFEISVSGGVVGSVITEAGTYTVTITDPDTGNSCWSTINVEDKRAPMLEDCACPIGGSPVETPFVGTLDGTDPLWTRPFVAGGVCNPSGAGVDIPYDTYSFGLDMDAALGAEVVTFTAPSGDSFLALYEESFDPTDPCANLVITNDDGGVGLLSQFNVMLNTGVNYILVVTTFNNNGNDFGDYVVEITSGATLVENAEECNFRCVDVDFIMNSDDLTPNPTVNSCGSFETFFTDELTVDANGNQIILRTWLATNANGSSTCTQQFNIAPLKIEDLTLPISPVILTCNDGTDPADIVAIFDNPLTTDNPNTSFVENNEGYVFTYPTYLINGHPQKVDNNVCDIYAAYTDQELAACEEGCNGNRKVIRTWTLVDWKTLEIETYIQTIKAVDTDAPTLLTKDVTVSTDAWGCEASFEAPLPWELHDNCDSNPEYSITGPAGVTITGSFEEGYFISGAPKGVHTFNYIAYDCCGNEASFPFTVTVIDSTPPVVVAKQNVVISLTSGSTNGAGLAKLYAESIDNGSYDGCSNSVKLEIRRDEDICDVLGNATYNADGHPQDGSPNPNSPSYDPDGGAYVKFCCADLTNATVDVNGDGEFDAGYLKVWLRVWDDGDMDGVFGSEGDNYNEAWAFVKVEDKLAPAITCPVDVTLTCDMDYTDLGMTGSASAFGSCGGIDVEYNDIIINLNSCNEGFVRRRWSVVGRSDIFCDQTITLEDLAAPVNVSFSQVQDFTAANCPDMIALGEPTWVAGPCDVLGYTLDTDTFRFEDGACYKLVNLWTVINWCDYEPNNPFWNGEGIWEHTQVIKVTDETQPVIEDCEDKMFAINDHSDSDNDGVICEAMITLTNVATDPGSENCPTGWLKWQVFVDLWGDGTNDLEYSSFLPPFDNNFNDTNGNGIADVYVAPTANGETVSIPLQDIEGSMSNHKVSWKVTDGCNNVTTCDYEFMVVDKKAPTPYCVDLSTAVMESSGTVELWAIDFNVGSFDNCSAQEDLRYTFSSTAPEDDSNYDATQRSSSMTFDCDDVENSPVEVNMYVWDEKGNADFCMVFLTIIDNENACSGSKPSIGGKVATESGAGVEEVEVTLNAALPEYPKLDMTDVDGGYVFADNSLNASYEISGSKDIDYMNGVSTLDLVKIQRHILGLESLNSPYKLIAADVNADNDVKTSDLTELRKLILGIISDLPTNESWRFVDAGQSMSMDMDLADMDYELQLNNVQGNTLDNDLIAIKIGDVTENALVNFTSAVTEVRSSKTLGFSIEEQSVEAGEKVSVDFTSDNFEEVFGYQFTMELNGLEFAGIQRGALNTRDEHVGVLSSNVLTMSYNNMKAINVGKDETVFTLEFIANQSGNLSEMLDITSKVTRSEAYVGESLEIRGVEITTRGEVASINVTELYQNVPNPFTAETEVGFNLSEGASATMTVFDVTGKVIMVKDIDGVRGYNTVNFAAKELGASGVLYYTLESGEFTATKKMIIIE